GPRYDQAGHEAVTGAPGTGRGVDFSGFDLADALRAFMRDFGGDLGGFEELFGGGGARRGGASRGDDLQVRLKLTLEEIATGVQKKIRVRHLRACGDCGPRGGPAGDLIVLIEEKPHAVFERDGRDLHIDVPVHFATAVLGGKAETPSLEGEALLVEIPSGTASGTVLRVRGRGLPGLRGGGRGDLQVRVMIWVPDRVSAEDKRLLEELRRSESLKPPKPGRT